MEESSGVLASKEVRIRAEQGQGTLIQWMLIEQDPGEEIEKEIRGISIVEYLDTWQRAVEIEEMLEERLRRSQKRTEISKPLAGLQQ